MKSCDFSKKLSLFLKSCDFATKTTQTNWGTFFHKFELKHTCLFLSLLKTKIGIATQICSVKSVANVQ